MSSLRTLFVVMGLLTISLTPTRAEDDAGARVEFDKLLAAQDTRNYDAFVADADDEVKAALSQVQFDAACNVLDARGTAGREVTFLGELNQHGVELYLYRLRFKEGDDILATMALKDDKVAGIWFK